MITVFINPCDDGEYCSNTKKTNNQSPNRISVPIQFQITCNRIYVESLEEETCEKKKFNEVITQLETPFNSYNRASHGTVLHATLHGFTICFYTVLAEI